MLGGLLAYNEVRGKVSTLVNSKEVVRLHDELRGRPKDEALKEQIRQLDLQLRRETFYRLRLSHDASRALLGGLAVFLASAHFVRISRRRLPDPQAWGARKAGEEKRSMALARHAVAAVSAVIAVSAIILSTRPVSLPEPAPPAPSVAAVEAPLSPEELKNQWPSFRGSHGLGVSPEPVLAATMEPTTAVHPDDPEGMPQPFVPLAWDAKTGKNIRWQSAVPLPGFSSPVVWGHAIFLTGADATQSCVFRFDSETGALQWTATVKLPGGTRPPKPQVGDDTGLAAPTPVTDGRQVYALFPTGEIAAFDFAGKQIWARDISPLENAYGFAASPAIYQDRLFIQIDRGMADEGLSRLLSLDTRTGQPRWEVKRDVAASWSSPVLFEVGGQPQLITCAKPFVIAYNPLDGKELWRNECLESDVAPTPVMAGDMIVAVAPNTAIIGLHPGAKDIAWKVEENIPEATSPVSDGRRVYLVTGEGMLTCYNVQTGKAIWNHDLENPFYASPMIAGQALVLVSRKGQAWVLATGDEYKELGKGALGEPCCASPVPVGRRLLLRGKKTLFCIESK